VVPLGEWALSSACRQVREWSGTGLPVRVAVNISARHFQQRDLAATVRNAIESAGIQARQVQIEISEAIAMRDVDLTVELLNRLRETGVSIAIDSFGSAYSAFGSLRALPIDAVKLDRRFIEHAGQPGPDAAIVDAVIAVSRSLGLRVCADGVERREQYHFLAAHGCEDGQGSYFSPPLDGESFGSYARSRRPIAGPK
jgi:EAL domain-containing protein (putative c-di-GMP-specific phosphodiesterase class I)